MLLEARVENKDVLFVWLVLVARVLLPFEVEELPAESFLLLEFPSGM